MKYITREEAKDFVPECFDSELISVERKVKNRDNLAELSTIWLCTAPSGLPFTYMLSKIIERDGEFVEIWTKSQYGG